VQAPPSHSARTARFAPSRRQSSLGAPTTCRGIIPAVADLLADVRRVRQVADVFGPASTALSMRKVAERALEHDDDEVRRLANQLLAELERSPALRRRR